MGGKLGVVNVGGLPSSISASENPGWRIRIYYAIFTHVWLCIYGSTNLFFSFANSASAHRETSSSFRPLSPPDRPPTMAPTSAKKSAASPKTRSSSSASGGMTLKRVKGENFYRNAKAASRLKMLNGGKPVYDRDGKIKEAALFQKGEDEAKPGRVQPDRRWFGM